MILAETGHCKAEPLAQARNAAAFLDRLFALGKLSEAEIEAAAQLFAGIAVAHKNAHLLNDAIGYARRSIELSRLLPNAQLSLSQGLSTFADLLRLSGDLEGAFQAIKEARIHLDKADFSADIVRRSSWFTVFWREAKILGARKRHQLESIQGSYRSPSQIV